MYKEELMMSQRRADLEGFVARQRLLKQARLESSGFRYHLALVLMGAAILLEPDLNQSRKAKC